MAYKLSTLAQIVTQLSVAEKALSIVYDSMDENDYNATGGYKKMLNQVRNYCEEYQSKYTRKLLEVDE